MKDYREGYQKGLPFYRPLRDEGFIHLYIDGASRGNPGKAGVGVVIKGSDGQIVEEVSKYIGVTTNNRAEYIALIEGLKKVKSKEFGVRSLRIFTDSELLVKQLKREYKVRDSNLKILYHKVSALLSEFEEVDIKHIPRKDNKEADKLANRAIDAISHKKIPG